MRRKNSNNSRAKKQSRFIRIKKVGRRSHAEYQRRLTYIKQYERVPFAAWKRFTPSNKRYITRHYRALRRLDVENNTFVHLTSKQRKQYDARNHIVTSKGVFVAKEHKKQIIHKMTAEAITMKYGQRTEINIYFTDDEKFYYVSEPEELLERVKLEKRKHGLSRRKVHVRFIFGAHLSRFSYADFDALYHGLANISGSGKEWISGFSLIYFKKPVKSKKAKKTKKTKKTKKVTNVGKRKTAKRITRHAKAKTKKGRKRK